MVLLGRDHHFLLAFGADATTTFELEETEAPYLLLWITELDSGSAHVNEVTAG